MYIKVVLAYLRVSSRPVSKGSRDRGATEEGSGQSVILIRTWPLPSPSTQGRVYRAKTSKEGRGVAERSGGVSNFFSGGEWRECLGPEGKYKGWIGQRGEEEIMFYLPEPTDYSPGFRFLIKGRWDV